MKGKTGKRRGKRGKRRRKMGEKKEREEKRGKKRKSSKILVKTSGEKNDFPERGGGKKMILM